MLAGATLYAAMRASSNVTRICRRCPPMILTSETSLTSFDLIVNLRGNAAQSEVIVGIAGESERQDRDVINRTRFDDRQTGARGNQIEVGRHLLIETNNACLFILADVKAHDRHRITGDEVE